MIWSPLIFETTTLVAFFRRRIARLPLSELVRASPKA
jgi:hypothetical protein